MHRRKGAEARRELLSCAAQLFDKYGYESVSVKDIADALGWTKSLMYYYCTGKEQLVRQAAAARAVELAAGLSARMETAGSSPERLNRALGCVGFWSQGSEEAAARLLGTLYSAGSLPWRACLRAEIVPQLAGVCNDIIADGVKSYDMYTPYPREMAEAALDMAADLAEKLAPLVMEGGAEALYRADSLLRAYRCSIERLVEAPFGSIRLVELSFLEGVARRLGRADGGAEDEAHGCSDGGATDDTAERDGAGA